MHFHDCFCSLVVCTYLHFNIRIRQIAILYSQTHKSSNMCQSARLLMELYLYNTRNFFKRLLKWRMDHIWVFFSPSCISSIFPTCYQNLLWDDYISIGTLIPDYNKGKLKSLGSSDMLYWRVLPMSSKVL